jgi:hypothetical protein
VITVEELVWKLEEAADRVEEWAFWTSLSVRENIENLWDRVSEIPQALSDYFQDIGFRLENLPLSVEIALENLSTRLQEWWEEQKANFQEILERMGAQIKEVGAWLNENVEKVALGVGVAGTTLGIAGLGPERIWEDVPQFYQGAVAVVQVDLKERVAAFIEEVKGLDDFAKQIMGDIAQGKLPFSSYGETSHGEKVDPNYGEKADPKGGPEPW